MRHRPMTTYVESPRAESGDLQRSHPLASTDVPAPEAYQANLLHPLPSFPDRMPMLLTATYAAVFVRHQYP